MSKPSGIALFALTVLGCGEVRPITDAAVPDPTADARPGQDARPGDGPGAYLGQRLLGTSFGSVALAPDGDVAMAGSFTGTVNLGGAELVSAGQSDIWVARFSSDGEHRWSRQLGAGDNEFIVGLTVSPLGDQLIRVVHDGSLDLGGGDPLVAMGNLNTAVASYAPGGDFLWSLGIGSTGTVAGWELSADGSGGVVLAGDFDAATTGPIALPNSTGSKDIFFARLRRDGTVALAESLDDAQDQHGAVAIFDQLGSVYLAGAFAGSLTLDQITLESAGGTDLFIAKLTAQGVGQWAMRAGGPGNDDNVFAAVDGSGNLVLTGTFETSMSFENGEMLTSAGQTDIFLATISPEGRHLWSKSFGGVGVDRPRHVAANESGQIALGGEFTDVINLGGDDLASQGFVDAFVAKYEADGNHAWSRGLGGAADDRTGNVAITPAGEVFTTINYQTTIDFGGGMVTSNGEWQSALVKYGP